MLFGFRKILNNYTLLHNKRNSRCFIDYLYKFLINSHLNKNPDSIEPLQDLIRYYSRINEDKTARKFYEQMKEQYNDSFYIKLHLLYESNESYEQKQ